MADAHALAVPLPQPLTHLDLRACQHVAFLSDVHLHPDHAATHEAWQHHLQTLRTDALFVLGDLFDVWLGDDVLDHPSGDFERACLSRLRAFSQTTPVYWLVGNRDFLLGPAACALAGMTAISDPCVVHADDKPWLLSHGDALCLSDTAYQTYRQQMRSPQGLAHLQALSLEARMQLARSLKDQSQTHKSQTMDWVDVDEAACRQWLDATESQVLIHGHTHLPADHALGPHHIRVVLSDWDAQARPARLQSLEWQRGQGFRRREILPA